ncbi:MAG: histone deacetylase [Planctomycetota bacterium]
MSDLAVATSPTFRDHRPPDGAPHPERPERYDAMLAALEGMPHRLLDEPEPVDDETLLMVHGQAHVEQIGQLSRRGRWADADTYVGVGSDEIARRGVACCLAAADAVATGESKHGLAIVRPPGHHAEPDRPMGFCLYANAALVVRHLQRQHGMDRVAVVDFDVHHGNGTQAVFWRDPSVLTVSLHGHPDHLWPHTGSADEIGEGTGEGACLNVPLMPGCSDDDYRKALVENVLPQVRAFQPEALVVCAGFDAHEDDPLANLALTTPFFDEIGRLLASLAHQACEGRIVMTSEGGYDLKALTNGMNAFLKGLGKQD